MKCRRCGTENPKGKSICLKCGKFLYSANPNNRAPLTKEQKKQRRRSIFKGTSLGCLWSALAIIGMFILLGIISYLLVRFVIPEDYFNDLATISSTQNPGENSTQMTTANTAD